MNLKIRLCSVILLVGFLFVPIQTKAQVSETDYSTTLLELISLLQKQVVVLQAELEKRQERIVSSTNQSGLFQDSVDVIVQYVVPQPSAVVSIRDQNHREYFTRLFQLLPNEYVKKIKRLVVFNGRHSEHTAFVETIPPEHEVWMYAIDKDSLDRPDSVLSIELMVHELGHMVSYEEILGVPKPAQTNCNTYFKLYGCPAANSFLAKFVSEFWSSANLNRVADSAKLKNSYNYYLKNKDEYVTDYAATSPEEDFSETFMYFVLDISTSGKESQRKIDYLASFPAINSLKNEIIANKISFD